MQLELITVKDAANQLKVHEDTIRRYIKAGDLPAFRINKSIIRIVQSDLDKLRSKNA